MTRITGLKRVVPVFSEAGSDSFVLTPSQSTEAMSRDYLLTPTHTVTGAASTSCSNGNGNATTTCKSHETLMAKIHHIASDNTFYLSCEPPRVPATSLKHTPCDIVLVIDLSGSMMDNAPPPDHQDGGAEEGDVGLSILDLVKHSARVIVENMNEHDRLAIVTFAFDAKIVQDLIPMTDDNKEATCRRIEGLQAYGLTNLWSGIRSGLQLFEKLDPDFSNLVQGMFVLTDGQPNHMCPKQGYVNKMRPMLAGMGQSKAKVGLAMPTIHTFGFGYSIRSDLMQSIAEIGNGNYAFIPDAGMIGTVFVHAVANLFSTFAVNAMLEFEAASGLELGCSTIFNKEKVSDTKTIFHLGNILYGQSRNILLTYHSSNSNNNNNNNTKNPSIMAKLSCRDHLGSQVSITLDPQSSDGSDLAGDSTSYAYHILRAQLCDHLAAFSPISQSSHEHAALMEKPQTLEQLNLVVGSMRKFIRTICSHPQRFSDAHIASLIDDLTAAEGEQHGQVSKAIQTSDSPVAAPPSVAGQGEKERPSYYDKWGRHYLPSLLHAHARQVCNSFKDPGPLMYGQDSPLFVHCRDDLDQAFENLPAPRPTLLRGGDAAAGAAVPVQMSRYNSRSAPCFSGGSKVLLAEAGSKSLLPIEELRPGHQVWTLAGARKVVSVLRTDLPEARALCKLTGNCKDLDLDLDLDLWVTPWHPVLVNGTWKFPAEVAEEVKLSHEPVYSLLLERREKKADGTDGADEDGKAHTVTVGGVVAVTLGHGITTTTTTTQAASNAPGSDIRAHGFFGDWKRVKDALDGLTVDSQGRHCSGGVVRDGLTGLVCGFQVPVPVRGPAPVLGPAPVQPPILVPTEIGVGHHPVAVSC